MEKIIKAYKEAMRKSRKDIEAILLVEIFENKEGAMILSETSDEWIIHPVRFHKRTGEQKESVWKGEGSYMFKDRYTYQDAKAQFRERIGG
jgi:hypothetical protein